MCDSPVIVVTVTSGVVETNITLWDISPRSGSLPLTVTIDGFLFRNNIQENRSDSTIVDGETVYLQQFDHGSQTWGNILTMTTGYDSARGYHGHFYATAQFDPTAVPGQYSFRCHFNGNSSKNLGGCEK